MHAPLDAASRRAVAALLSCLALALVAACGATPPTARATRVAGFHPARPTDVVTRSGTHFRVHVHFDAPQLADEVLAIAERTWELATPLYTDAPRAPDPPLDLHLYRDAAAYEAVDQALTGGRFQRNQAFAWYADSSAHVALQPPLHDATLRRVGLPKQTARLLAHEAAHLVRVHHMPNHDAHPKWLVDGLASSLDFELLLDTGRAESRELDPGAGAAWDRTRALLAGDEAPDVAAILDGDDADVPFYTRYALRWMFVDMLRARHPEELARFLRALREVDAWWRPKARAAQAFRRVFAERLARLDADLAEHLAAQQPLWREHIASLETAGEVWLQAAFPSSNAVSWCTRPLPAEGFVLRGHARLLPGDGRQFNLRFGAPDDFVQLAVHTEGGLSTFHYDGAWRRLEASAAAPFEIGEELAFELRHDAARRTLQVRVGDAELRLDDFAPAADARWGIGAQAGSAVEWRALELAPR